MEKADENLVSGRVAEVMFDENLMNLHMETFFTAMEQPIYDGMNAYAKSKEKRVDDLTDDEIMFVIDKVADLLLSEMMNLFMESQSVPELLEATHGMELYEA